MKTKKYPSDLTDAQWAIIEPLIPPAWPGGRPRKHSMRLIFDALLYHNREGCSWRALPHDFPPWKTVYNYLCWFEADGTWDSIMHALGQQVRIRAKRNPTPSAACIDSQTVKSACGGEEIGTDGGKNTRGRKRHILTDTMGFVLAVVVTAGNVDDGAAASEVLNRVPPESKQDLKTIFADMKYRNHEFQAYAEEHGFKIQISMKDPDQKGFQPLKKRWVVEQTFGCMSRWRRLNRDYEKTTTSSEAMVKLSSIHRMVRRLKPDRSQAKFQYQQDPKK